MLDATVREAGQRFRDATAFVDPDGSRLSFRDLDHQSDQIAAGMADRGIQLGDRVALCLPSDTGYVLAYVAAAKLGAITAGINPRLTEREQASLVDLADPALVLRDPGEVDELIKAGKGRQATVPALRPEPTRPVAIVFTSGTTGLPKGAVFTSAQFDAIAQIDTGGRWAESAGTSPGGPANARIGPAMLASTQFAHVGFMTKLPWYLRLATETHILERWRAGDALRTIAEQGITSIGGVAPQVALMLRSPEMERHDWSHVQTIIMGGAASPPALVHEARQRFGAAYSIRYSSTESGGCGLGTAFDADDAEALYTVGKPRPGIEITIRDDEGQRVAPGERGELWFRSPTQMSHYWRAPDETAATVTPDGWLRTGDLARLDEHGNVVLAGRRKEMFIRGGYNVYPAEVEALLIAHPGISHAAVVPRPDPVMGEIGVAVVVPGDPTSPPTLEDLRLFLSNRLAAYKLPEALRLVDELPLTPMQKLDRQSLITHERQQPG